MKERTPQLYKDLDLSFKPHPLTGDLTPKTNDDAIKSSLKNLVNMSQFDIPFEARKRTNLKEMLFQPLTQLTESELRVNLEWFIKKMEPRIKLNDIKVQSLSNGTGLLIQIFYHIKSLLKDDDITIKIQRKR